MLLIIIATAGYFIATFGVLRTATRGERTPWILPIAAAELAHAAYHIKVARYTLGGADMHLFAALSLTALGMAVLTTVFCSQRRAAALGVIVFPLASVLLILYALGQHLPGPLLDWHLRLHAWLALLAYATLSIAALFSMMLWLQDHTLRKHNTYRWMTVLPPLTEVETLLFRTMAAGFTLLTLTLLTGLLFVDNFLAPRLLHKTILSILSWFVFGALLVGRWKYGWRGIKAVHLTLTAMVLLILAYFGSQFAVEHLYHEHTPMLSSLSMNGF